MDPFKLLSEDDGPTYEESLESDITKAFDDAVARPMRELFQSIPPEGQTEAWSFDEAVVNPMREIFTSIPTESGEAALDDIAKGLENEIKTAEH